MEISLTGQDDKKKTQTYYVWAPPKTKLNGERVIEMALIQLLLEVIDMVPLVEGVWGGGSD